MLFDPILGSTILMSWALRKDNYLHIPNPFFSHPPPPQPLSVFFLSLSFSLSLSLSLSLFPPSRATERPSGRQWASNRLLVCFLFGCGEKSSDPLATSTAPERAAQQEGMGLRRFTSDSALCPNATWNLPIHLPHTGPQTDPAGGYGMVSARLWFCFPFECGAKSSDPLAASRAPERPSGKVYRMMSVRLWFCFLFGCGAKFSNPPATYWAPERPRRRVWAGVGSSLILLPVQVWRRIFRSTCNI